MHCVSHSVFFLISITLDYRSAVPGNKLLASKNDGEYIKVAKNFMALHFLQLYRK